MRIDHFLCFIFVPIVQSILLLAAGTNRPGAVTTRPFAILALVVPIACYVWALRDAPIAPKNARPAVRYAVLGLVAVGLSLGGFLFGLEFITAHTALK